VTRNPRLPTCPRFASAILIKLCYSVPDFTDQGEIDLVLYTPPPLAVDASLDERANRAISVRFPINDHAYRRADDLIKARTRNSARSARNRFKRFACAAAPLNSKQPPLALALALARERGEKDVPWIHINLRTRPLIYARREYAFVSRRGNELGAHGRLVKQLIKTPSRNWSSTDYYFNSQRAEMINTRRAQTTLNKWRACFLMIVSSLLLENIP